MKHDTVTILRAQVIVHCKVRHEGVLSVVRWFLVPIRSEVSHLSFENFRCVDVFMFCQLVVTYTVIVEILVTSFKMYKYIEPVLDC